MKIKSLAAEARIIRREERRTQGGLRESLYLHRIWDVRREQRAAMLAYGFIRGRRYGQVEANARTAPDSKRVAELVARFGPRDFGAPMNQRVDRIRRLVEGWIKDAEPCGRHLGVMTPGTAGSTPAASSKAG